MIRVRMALGLAIFTLALLPRLTARLLDDVGATLWDGENLRWNLTRTWHFAMWSATWLRVRAVRVIKGTPDSSFFVD